ncbi:hypothetical protein LCGC14_2403980 [marine sediment metagenome]|uniref:Peptidase M24 domain-containing protein n=1 Tax=marine sediment metagenome TaxID=412755 RepID=A0A0F9BUG3_9ZZZZ
MILLKTKEELDIMDEANKFVHDVLDYIESHISIGVSTRELDSMAEEFLQQSSTKTKAEPAFKGYMGYPASLCVSINEEVVHGIPSDRIIQDGDIVSLDFGVKYKGFVGDAARTIIIGSVPEEVIQLVHNTKEALKLGVNQMRVGNRLHDIGKAIESMAHKHKYGNVKNFCGHGIGRNIHEEPHVFNFVNLNEPNIRLQEGMVLALEPMFNLGTSDVKLLKDKWTVITNDNNISAHFEVSVAVTRGEPRVLGNSQVFDS